MTKRGETAKKSLIGNPPKKNKNGWLATVYFEQTSARLRAQTGIGQSSLLQRQILFYSRFLQKIFKNWKWWRRPIRVRQTWWVSVSIFLPSSDIPLKVLKVHTLVRDTGRIRNLASQITVNSYSREDTSSSFFFHFWALIDNHSEIDYLAMTGILKMVYLGKASILKSIHYAK